MRRWLWIRSALLGGCADVLQCAVSAGIHVHCKSFWIVNPVGDCDYKCTIMIFEAEPINNIIYIVNTLSLANTRGAGRLGVLRQLVPALPALCPDLGARDGHLHVLDGASPR